MATKKKTNLMFLATLITVGGTIIVALINGWFNSSSKVRGAEQSISNTISDSSRTDVQNIQIKQRDSGKVEINNIKGDKIDKQIINNITVKKDVPQVRHLSKEDIKKLQTIPANSTVDLWREMDKETENYTAEIIKWLRKRGVNVSESLGGSIMTGSTGKRFYMEKRGENDFAITVKGIGVTQ